MAVAGRGRPLQGGAGAEKWHGGGSAGALRHTFLRNTLLASGKHTPNPPLPFDLPFEQKGLVTRKSNQTTLGGVAAGGGGWKRGGGRGLVGLATVGVWGLWGLSGPVFHTRENNPTRQ